MKIRNFAAEVLLPASRSRVFPFFSDAGNLNKLTPPWLNFQILTPLPIEMRVGALIEYRIRIHGIPVRWKTRITEWEPPNYFVDEQISGPYRQWIHRHTFEERGDSTLARDEVAYAVPLDFLMHNAFVRPDIEKIFAYRTEVLQKLFARKE
jgi:ligand-binding SRPBCC domain-containing protein